MRIPWFVKKLASSAFLVAALIVSAQATAAEDPAADALGKEAGKQGWIVMAAYAQEIEAQQRLPDDNVGQADLYLMRPDGSEMRNITHTPDTHEFFVRFSADGKKIMFRRLRKSKDINHDSVGTQGELVFAASDGSNPVAFGKYGEYPWATWSPDTRQIACLYNNEGVIRFFDAETKQKIREMPNHGIFQQILVARRQEALRHSQGEGGVVEHHRPRPRNPADHRPLAVLQLYAQLVQGLQRRRQLLPEPRLGQEGREGRSLR